MKKHIAFMVIVVLLLAGVLTAYGQPAAIPIAYGDTVPGEISNRVFETLYSFEGKAGDLVFIEMRASPNASLDTYLYLTTLDNQILAQNDDYLYQISRVIASLPSNSTYQIVATRYGQRGGSGEGSYTLTLQNLRSAPLGVTLEGTAVQGESGRIHAFVPEDSGIFTVSYRHVSGDYFPVLRISKFDSSSSYMQELASIQGEAVRAGSVTLGFERGAVYILSIDPSNSYSEVTGSQALYTLQVNPLEE